MEKDRIIDLFQKHLGTRKKIAVLGMGREGWSSLRFLLRYFPDKQYVLADQNARVRTDFEQQKISAEVEFICGETYLEEVFGNPEIDLIFKTPGISLKDHPDYLWQKERLTSQADLFLKVFSGQCVGVTGTKGKSTTTHLIYHLLRDTFSCILAGNMGKPLLDTVEEIEEDSILVLELSSHQLESVQRPPKIGVLLNLYEEHLDHYVDFEAYQRTKLNICPDKNGTLIIPSEDHLVQLRLSEKIQEQGQSPEIYSFASAFISGDSHLAAYENDQGLEFRFSQPSKALYNGQILDVRNTPLMGQHNHKNMMAALLVGCCFGLSIERMQSGLKSFRPLPHRLAYIGRLGGIHYFNDSISTIPQACIAAIQSVEKMDFVHGVGSLVLGGMDRGIDYTPLIEYLSENPIKSITFVGNSGRRIFDKLQEVKALPENYLLENDYRKIVHWLRLHTAEGSACLLSPAAASYDQFKNFEERGNFFEQCVLEENKGEGEDAK